MKDPIKYSMQHNSSQRFLVKERAFEKGTYFRENPGKTAERAHGKANYQESWNSKPTVPPAGTSNMHP